MSGHPTTRAARRAAFDTIRRRYARIWNRTTGRYGSALTANAQRRNVNLLASTHGRPCSGFCCRRAQGNKGLFRDLAAEAHYRQDMADLAYQEYEESAEALWDDDNYMPSALTVIHDAYRNLRRARNQGCCATVDDRNHQALYDAIEASGFQH